MLCADVVCDTEAHQLGFVKCIKSRTICATESFTLYNSCLSRTHSPPAFSCERAALKFRFSPLPKHPSLEVRRQNQMMAPCTSCEAVSWVDECIRWFDLHPDFLGKRKSLLTRRPLKIKSFFFW